MTCLVLTLFTFNNMIKNLSRVKTKKYNLDFFHKIGHTSMSLFPIIDRFLRRRKSLSDGTFQNLNFSNVISSTRAEQKVRGIC